MREFSEADFLRTAFWNSAAAPIIRSLEDILFEGSFDRQLEGEPLHALAVFEYTVSKAAPKCMSPASSTIPSSPIVRTVLATAPKSLPQL